MCVCVCDAQNYLYFYDCPCVFAASAQGARRGRRPSMQEAIDVSKFDKKLYSGVRSFDILIKHCIYYVFSTYIYLRVQQ